MNLAEIFHAAANLIETRGHCKGIARSERGAFCTIGALGEVINYHGGFDAYNRAKIALAVRLPEVEIPCPVAAIIRWNDAPERTPAEVIGKLREVAVELEKQS